MTRQPTSELASEAAPAPRVAVFGPASYEPTVRPATRAEVLEG